MIDNEIYLRHLVYYIHNNPVHHGFSDHALDYGRSSYLSILSPMGTNVNRKEVIQWFHDTKTFKDYHVKHHEMDAVQDLLID